MTVHFLIKWSLSWDSYTKTYTFRNAGKTLDFKIEDLKEIIVHKTRSYPFGLFFDNQYYFKFILNDGKNFILTSLTFRIEDFGTFPQTKLIPDEKIKTVFSFYRLGVGLKHNI